MSDYFTVAINLQALQPGQIGGLETIVRKFINTVPRIDPHVKLLLFTNVKAAGTFAKSEYVNIVQLKGSDFPEKVYKELDERKADVYFCPLLVLEPLDIPIPTITCIPDIQHEFFPENFTQTVLRMRKKKYEDTTRISDRIVTISDFSKVTIQERLSVCPEKVNRIYLAPQYKTHQIISETDIHEFLKKHNLPKQIGIYPANTWPHKNHAGLLKAIAMYRSNYGDPPFIVFSGAKSEEGYSDYLKAVKEHSLDNYVKHLGLIEPQELAILFSAATFLVFPSCFEGFGLPIVEAMAFGTPILASRSTSIPEVAGDSALYFDPNNPEEIAESIHLILKDNKLKRRLIQNGHERIKKFSWEKFTRELLEILKEVASLSNLERPQRFPNVTVRVEPGALRQNLIPLLEMIDGQDYPNIRVVIMKSDNIVISEGEFKKEILERFPRLQIVFNPVDAHTKSNRRLSEARIILNLNSFANLHPKMISKAVNGVMNNGDFILVICRDGSGDEFLFFKTDVVNSQTFDPENILNNITKDHPNKVGIVELSPKVSYMKRETTKSELAAFGYVNKIYKQDDLYTSKYRRRLKRLVSLSKLALMFGPVTICKAIKNIYKHKHSNQ